jgi:hypothetical protein
MNTWIVFIVLKSPRGEARKSYIQSSGAVIRTSLSTKGPSAKTSPVLSVTSKKNYVKDYTKARIMAQRHVDGPGPLSALGSWRRWSEVVARAHGAR